MHLGHRMVLSVLPTVLGFGLVPPSHAEDLTSTKLSLAAPPTYAGTRTTLEVDLEDEAGAPVVDAPVVLERRTSGQWAPVATVTTDEHGHASEQVTLRKDPGDNVFRGSYVGDATHAPSTAQAEVHLKRRGSRVEIHGPATVVDERRVPVKVRWTTRKGRPIAGAVELYRSLAGGKWKRVATLHTGGDGRARISVMPRQDSRWRARAVGKPWVEGDGSPVHRVDNLPPGRPVRLPKAAPRPRRTLPPQGHAVGAGPNVAITQVPGRVWRQMTGVSWRHGCPVGRAQLRLVRVNYWDYQGYRRRGELVAHADAAGAMGAALAGMYHRGLPIRAMYRVDRFGWGERSHGGDDYASMAAGNTSAFNCRHVTGRPGVRSPHSYGRSLDVNTWENPYRSARGTVPNTWWQPRSHPQVAWRSRSHAVVEVMARHGLRWTYGTGDTQHFDYVGSSARASARPIPCDRYCD